MPVIIATPAYRDGELIVTTFDEGNGTAACCGETSGLAPSHPIPSHRAAALPA